MGRMVASDGGLIFEQKIFFLLFALNFLGREEQVRFPKFGLWKNDLFFFHDASSILANQNLIPTLTQLIDRKCLCSFPLFPPMELFGIDDFYPVGIFGMRKHGQPRDACMGLWAGMVKFSILGCFSFQRFDEKTPLTGTHFLSTVLTISQVFHPSTFKTTKSQKGFNFVF